MVATCLVKVFGRETATCDFARVDVWNWEILVMDIVFVGLVLVLYALSWGFIKLCEEI